MQDDDVLVTARPVHVREPEAVRHVEIQLVGGCRELPAGDGANDEVRLRPVVGGGADLVDIRNP